MNVKKIQVKFRKYKINRKNLVDVLVSKLFGVNSKAYWNSRFNRNWIENNGRIQTALFAASLSKIHFDKAPLTILDFGCGTGDSTPFLKLKFGMNVKIFLYDFSEKARVHQKIYTNHAEILDRIEENMAYDLVYCSNVIEHIETLESFLEEVSRVCCGKLVIQAPFDERHSDGTEITNSRKKGEHVRTVNLQTIQLLPKGYVWTYQLVDVPFAWDYGQQIFFIGDKIIKDIDVA